MLTATDRAALKTAFRLLVHDVGGLEAACAVTGYSVSRLSEAYAPNSERMPRVDHALMLEMVGGNPRVSEVMARLQGLRLERQQAARGEDGAALGAVIESAGHLGAEALKALADGRLDDSERAAVRERLAAHRRDIERAEAVLAGSAPRALKVVG